MKSYLTNATRRCTVGQNKEEKWQVNQTYAYFQHIKNLSLLISDLPIVGGGIAVMCGGTQNLMHT